MTIVWIMIHCLVTKSLRQVSDNHTVGNELNEFHKLQSFGNFYCELISKSDQHCLVWNSLLELLPYHILGRGLPYQSTNKTSKKIHFFSNQWCMNLEFHLMDPFYLSDWQFYDHIQVYWDDFGRNHDNDQPLQDKWYHDVYFIQVPELFYCFCTWNCKPIQVESFIMLDLPQPKCCMRIPLFYSTLTLVPFEICPEDIYVTP